MLYTQFYVKKFISIPNRLSEQSDMSGCSLNKTVTVYAGWLPVFVMNKRDISLHTRSGAGLRQVNDSWPDTYNIKPGNHE